MTAIPREKRDSTAYKPVRDELSLWQSCFIETLEGCPSATISHLCARSGHSGLWLERARAHTLSQWKTQTHRRQLYRLPRNLPVIPYRSALLVNTFPSFIIRKWRTRPDCPLSHVVSDTECIPRTASVSVNPKINGFRQLICSYCCICGNSGRGKV